jgi:hypothetical protein
MMPGKGCTSRAAIAVANPENDQAAASTGIAARSGHGRRLLTIYLPIEDLLRNKQKVRSSRGPAG